MAICVVFVPAAAVGAVGTPVRAGEANGAFNPKSVIKFETSDWEIEDDEDITPLEFVFTYPAVESGSVMVPVNVGLAIGAFPERLVVIVLEKLESLFKAAASSFKVSNAAGAEFTIAAAAVEAALSAYVFVANAEVSVIP